MKNSIEEYRRLAMAWAASSREPEKANRLLAEHHALYKVLRETDTGRSAISKLVDDPETAVRLLASGHSLAWKQHRAEQVLEELAREASALGLDAKWTLRSFRSGKLNLDW